MDLPFKFCKIGLKNTLFIFGRKNGRLLFVVVVVVVVVCCNFVRFWLTFFLIEAFIELRKMILRKKVYHVRFGNCSTPKVLDVLYVCDVIIKINVRYVIINRFLRYVHTVKLATCGGQFFIFIF